VIILAMESSAKPSSVALCSDGKLLGQYFQNSGLTHSRTLMAMTEDLLKNLDLKTQDIDLIAVSQGPGSFTGVRIGVSAAKGLAWGLNKPICGVSTLEAMVYQTPMPDVILCPVMDARRSQVYNALFSWKNDSVIRLTEDRAISLKDLVSDLRLSDYESQCKIPHSDIILVGDGAQITYDFLSVAGIPCRIAPSLLQYQTAYGVALVAANSLHSQSINLEPSYLRPSQAERERGNG